MTDTPRVRSSPATTSDELAATLPGIVWEADGTNYRMEYVSPRARDLLGLDPDEWTSVPDFWEAHVHPDDRERAIEAVDRALRDVASISVEYRFRGGDGAYRHFRDVLRVIEQPDGRRHIVGFMVDVSDDAEVQHQRRLLAAAVHEARESVVITDRRGQVVYANPAFEAMSGYQADEAVGDSVWHLGAGGAVGSSLEAQAAMDAGRSWAGDLAGCRRDGTTYTEEASISPVLDDTGGIEHWVTVSRDVTAERAERRAQARLAAIVESATDAGYANDLDGTYLAWNDAAARIYGWSRDEVMGRTVFDMAGPEEHESIQAWIDRVREGNTYGPVDAVHRGRDGRLLTLSVAVAPVFDDEGRVSGIATIARDVSDERRLAAERLAIETHLLQAQKLEAIGRLAGGIAHDFNNMLTAIRGYAGLVAGELSGQLLDDQRQVLYAAERASELTRRLLAFSSSAPVHPRPVDIDAVLDDAYRMVRRLVPERVELVLDVQAGACVVADPVELEQLLLNLVVNAADAIPGTGRVSVTTRLVDRARGVEVAVADTGVGMDDATRARIFEPFFTTKGFGNGTGLGLATVHSIVRRAGGAIRVESAPGAGSTFTVELPASSQRDERGHAIAAPMTSGTERVLVVDDSVVVAELAARVLRSAGHVVSVETRPAAILERGVDAFDAIVTDVVMPGMSGPELVSRLGTDLPVVYMSGYTGDHLPADMGLGERRSLVAKPFTADQLVGALRSVLDA